MDCHWVEGHQTALMLRTAAAAVTGMSGSRNLSPKASKHQGATALIKSKRKNSAEKCVSCEGFTREVTDQRDTGIGLKADLCSCEQFSKLIVGSGGLPAMRSYRRTCMGQAQGTVDSTQPLKFCSTCSSSGGERISC